VKSGRSVVVRGSFTISDTVMTFLFLFFVVTLEIWAGAFSVLLRSFSAGSEIVAASLFLSLSLVFFTTGRGASLVDEDVPYFDSRLGPMRKAIDTIFENLSSVLEVSVVTEPLLLISWLRFFDWLFGSEVFLGS